MARRLFLHGMPTPTWLRRKSADPSRDARVRLHALLLDDPDATVRAVRRLRRAGFEVADVHSPFPLHGVEEAMGLRATRLPVATAVGGAGGALLGLGFQAWTSAWDWPLNIGGKSALALPALLPVTFEVAVLLAAFATVGALLLRGRLHPFATTDDEGATLAAVTDDRFAILVREADGSFDRPRLERMLDELGVERLVEGWRVT